MLLAYEKSLEEEDYAATANKRVHGLRGRSKNIDELGTFTLQHASSGRPLDDRGTNQIKSPS